MSDAPVSQTKSTPIHLWIVGVLSLLWSLVGAYDYLMTQTENEAYMADFEPAQLEYFYNFPTWLVVFWALAVWCSVAGSISLLVRKRFAEQILLVSFVSMVITAIYNFGFSNGMEIMGTGGFIFTLVIFFIGLGLWLYARAMRMRGVLS